jgi:hypothetical protein
MQLDIRVPIGLMFAILGAILTLVGLVANSAIYARSLGLNVNLWWGIVLLALGALLLWLGWRAQRTARLPGE